MPEYFGMGNGIVTGNELNEWPGRYQQTDFFKHLLLRTETDYRQPETVVNDVEFDGQVDGNKNTRRFRQRTGEDQVNRITGLDNGAPFPLLSCHPDFVLENGEIVSRKFQFLLISSFRKEKMIDIFCRECFFPSHIQCYKWFYKKGEGGSIENVPVVIFLNIVNYPAFPEQLQYHRRVQ